MQSAIQSVTHNLPIFIQTPLTSLIGQECYTTLIYNVDLSSSQCLRLTISKALGLAIVVFGSIMKIPQIVNIVSWRSARGISLSMYSLEVVAYTISLTYAIRMNLPFSTYGENLSLTFQNMIITLLVIAYSTSSSPASSKTNQVLLAATLMAISSLVLTVIPLGPLTFLQALTIPISLTSKLPQIIQLYKDKARGQLSSIVVFAQLLGTIARVFTTMTETNDQLLLWGFALATIFNAIIVVQVIIYWNGDQLRLVHSENAHLNEAPISISTHGAYSKTRPIKVD